MCTLLLATLLVACGDNTPDPIPDARPSIDECGAQPELPYYAPPTRTTDPIYGPEVIMFAKDYDATVNYDNDLLSWALCEKTRST
jgi:hypothetical protein